MATKLIRLALLVATASRHPAEQDVIFSRKGRVKRWVYAFLLAPVLLVAHLAAAANQAGLIQIDGAISPATADYIARATDQAAAQNFQCLVIQLDTPGGLLDSTREIVQSIYRSKVPVVVYVAPPGAYAGSAGVFITLSAHVAAMAPNTGIGAAHPVTAGGGEMDEVMKKKIVNFASSYIESIAQKRNRNIEWAKAAVTESATLTAEAALATNAIDLIALDLPALLQQIDGRTVDGMTLRTAGAEVVPIPTLFRERVLQLFWRPEVMFILMLIAIYGIIGEITSPGTIIPGVVGVIALILVLYMAAVLPVNIAGIALLALAVVLFVVEIFTPTFGLLAAGGLAAFILGALLLFDDPLRVFRLSWPFVITTAVITSVFFLFVVGAGLRAQWKPVRVGKETLLGKTTTALTPINAENGHVWVEGEYWKVVSDTPVNPGQEVQIVGSDGLTLKVKPVT